MPCVQAAIRAWSILVPTRAPNMSDIAAFYAHRSVLITGGTGFMGKVVDLVDLRHLYVKVMVEKLIRSCPRLDKIYLLVRCKGQHSGQERVNQMLESEVFLLLACWSWHIHFVPALL